MASASLAAPALAASSRAAAASAFLFSAASSIVRKRPSILTLATAAPLSAKRSWRAGWRSGT